MDNIFIILNLKTKFDKFCFENLFVKFADKKILIEGLISDFPTDIPT